jgi:hypothetical protein
MPDGRDLVAGLIKLFPPSNFFVFQLSLAAGIAALHGGLIRFMTEGQFPVVSEGKLLILLAYTNFEQAMLKSCDNGKSQGKSTTDKALLWLVSSPKNNKQKPSIAMATISKLLARTTFPYFFDDIRDQKLLCKILEARYDDQQTYTNSKVSKTRPDSSQIILAVF